MSNIVAIKNLRASLLAFLLVCLASPASGADLVNQPWKVEADKISRGVKDKEVVAQGNVILKRTGNFDNPLTINADWVRYDAEAGVVQARGHVKLRSKTESADAENATIYLKDETAQMMESSVSFSESNIHFSSKEARKDGEMVYFFRDGVFTTCDFTDERSPVWSLSMKEADIDVDGFIFMKHSLLRIKDVPVFYLPYMVFPGRMNRQSGFLDPEIYASDRGGSGFMAPYFWDLSPSSDITLYPAYFASRGPMIGGEFRHIHDYGSRFSVQATFLDDKLQDDLDDDYQDDGYLRTRSNRYWLRSKGDHDFGSNLKMLFDVDFASDRDYLMEFDEGATGFNESHDAFLRDFDRGLFESSLPWRPSSLQLVKNWSHVYVGGETTYVDDLIAESTPDATVIHTLPRLLTIGSLAIPATRANLNWNAEYVNYWRQEGVGMQRLDLHPRLTTPIPLGRWLEASATGGLRYTMYQVESYNDATYGGESSPTRRAWDGGLYLGTTLQRDFDLGLGSVRWLNHTIKPHTFYTYVEPDDNEEALPQFDSKDMVLAQSQSGYGFDNHFRVGGTDGQGKDYDRYFGSFNVSQTYDRRNDLQPYSDLHFALDMYPLERFRINYSTDLSVYGRGFVDHNLMTRYTNLRGDFLSVDFRNNKDSDIHEVNGSVQVRLLDTVSLRGDIKKSLAVGNVVSQSVSLLYQPGCWGMQVKFSESADDKQLSVLFSLVAFGQAIGVGYEDDLSASREFATSSDALDHDDN